MSFASWVPTIWILIVFSKPLGIWFKLGGTREEGSQLDRVFLIALLCLGIIILVKRKFKWSNAIKENIWLMLLIGYMLLSCLWSDSPFISLKRWSRELIAIVMVFIVATEPDPRKALESLFRRIIYICIPFSVILINYFAEYGRAYVHKSGDLMWTGVTMHKNQLCQLCVFAAFFLFWTFIKRWQRRNISTIRYQTFFEVIILILVFWLMGGPNHSLTYSATATSTFAVGLTTLIGLSWKKRWGAIIGSKALIALIAFIIIYGTVTPMLGRLSLLDVSSLVGRDKNLTGRTDVWEQLVPVVLEQPIIGCGYSSFWTTENREFYDMTGSHNGYLSVLLELGFVGLILFSIFILSSCRKIIKEMNRDFDWASLKICFLLIMVLHNITESLLDTFTFRMTAITLLLVVSPTAFTTYTPRVLRRLKHIAI